MSETKTRPTAQEITDAEHYVVAGFHAEGSPRTPGAMRAGADRLDRMLNVLAFARMALPPEEREIPVPWAETVPTPAPAVEPSAPEQFREGPQVEPPQTPTERVAAMLDWEVEAFVTGEGVGHWRECAGAHWERCWVNLDEDEAIDSYGTCFRPMDPAPESHDWRYDDKRGDTTTPEGRMECTRRLAVHLLAAKGAPNG